MQIKQLASYAVTYLPSVMMKNKKQVLTLPVMLLLMACIIILLLLQSTIPYDAVLGRIDDYHPHDDHDPLPLDDSSLKLFDNSSAASSSVSSRDRSPSRQQLFLHNNTAVVLHFQKPRRKFHGNHWFHICEHYLSQHMVIRQRLQQADILLSNGDVRLTGSHNSSTSWDYSSRSSSSMHSGYTSQSTASFLLRSIKHVKIITQQHELSAMMTRYSFYLVVLAVYQPGMQSIELFPPVQSYRQLARGGGGGGGQSSTSVSRPISSIDEATHSMVSFTAQGGPRFGFYAHSSSASNRIVDYSVDTIGIINQHHHHYHNSSRSTVIQDLLVWMMQMSAIVQRGS